jgi:hypothetical protein
MLAILETAAMQKLTFIAQVLVSKVAAPLAAAEVPEAQTNADALPAEITPLPGTRVAERAKSTKMAERASIGLQFAKQLQLFRS